MTAPVFRPPTNTRELVLQDTLKQLFQCASCGQSLLEQIPFGLVRPGLVHEIMCPGCHETWAFLRVANSLVTDQQLTPDDVVQLVDIGDHLDGPSRAAGVACQVCGRELTAPESIARRIGPVCAGKRGGIEHQLSLTSYPPRP